MITTIHSISEAGPVGARGGEGRTTLKLENI